MEERNVNIQMETRIGEDSDLKFSFPLEETALMVCREVLNQENCPYDAEISILLVGPEEIRALNRDYRGIDSVTDVLSFPGVDFPRPADFSMVEEQPASYLDPETDALFLGDIVLNLRRVREQAAEYGHSEKREYAFLIAHSMLHLCGYDHMTAEEAALMESRQETAMQSLGISREDA